MPSEGLWLKLICGPVVSGVLGPPGVQAVIRSAGRAKKKARFTGGTLGCRVVLRWRRLGTGGLHEGATGEPGRRVKTGMEDGQTLKPARPSGWR
ncbi:hypothetical protein GCM10008960_01320 [Deinococcus sedimenti]|uniref:Uncharacterized protein n=1 Tax=Deinococcus sedimenti TaxID=1867090 RepID=A0ABQ2RXH0_9DEIO|nr:hypothetical protein GCM10008960_01320 [Deinococcus sedimenti]